MWNIVKVYYHSGDQNVLIVNGILPLLQQKIYKYFVVRHWNSGPHVQVWIKQGEGVEDYVNELVAGIQEYLTVHPSLREKSEKDYVALANQLANYELEETILPLCSDNTVKLEHREADRDVVMLAYREFLLQTSPFTMDILTKIVQGEFSRTHAAIKIMVLLLTLLEKELNKSHFSYRSHVEGFLHHADQSGSIRDQFEKVFQEKQDQLLRIIQDTIIQQELGSEDVFHKWIQQVRIYRENIRADVEKGIFLPIKENNFLKRSQEIERTGVWNTQTEGSVFHQTIYKVKQIVDVMQSTEFDLWRLIMNFMYENLAQLGVKGGERFLFCYLISRSVETMRGTVWYEQLELLQS